MPVYLLPSVSIYINSPMYALKNFTLCVQWLGFDIKWFWMHKTKVWWE